MVSLKEVKNRITSVSSTQQITKAMKMVAAAKLRNAQEKILKIREYAKKLGEIMGKVAQSSNDEMIELALHRPIERVLMVVITSDRGLCGAFNSNIFKKTQSLINTQYSHIHKNIEVLPVGKKALEYCKKNLENVNTKYAHLMEHIELAEVHTAAEEIMSGFLEHKYDKVHLIYNSFKNVATQTIVDETYLPLGSMQPEEEEAQVVESYLFEPSSQEVLEKLVPQTLKTQFFKALLDSIASEHGARMTAMDKATENAEDLLKDLKLTYNRTRQATITKELLEIVGGAEALAQG